MKRSLIGGEDVISQASGNGKPNPSALGRAGILRLENTSSSMLEGGRGLGYSAVLKKGDEWEPGDLKK